MKINYFKKTLSNNAEKQMVVTKALMKIKLLLTRNGY